MVETKITAPLAALNTTAAEYVAALFVEKKPDYLHFHDFGHTELVADAARSLAGMAGLDAQDTEILEIAAYFQFTGMLEDYVYYEKKSAEIAANFLKTEGASEDFIDKVEHLILLPNSEKEPSDLMDKLYLDAYFSYYASKKYDKYLKNLHKEKNAVEATPWGDEDWERMTYAALKKHGFYTSKARKLFFDGKKANLKKAKKSWKQTKKAVKEALNASSISADSGARTMFKTALRNHIDLTNIADSKANMMLSINALIITIGLPAFATYLSGTSYLIVPATIFLLTSVATMIIATLSTRPVKMDGETDLAKLMSGKTNLFFFGNFYRLSQDEYQSAIRKVVADREHLDTSFINDLYFLGLALGDKFRYLRLCYGVFVVGLILSVVAFVITFIISSLN